MFIFFGGGIYNNIMVFKAMFARSVVVLQLCMLWTLGESHIRYVSEMCASTVLYFAFAINHVFFKSMC